MRSFLSVLSLNNHRFCLLALAVAIGLPNLARAQTSTRRVASRGLSVPVYGTTRPGDDEHMFVLEKDTGRIEILNLSDGTVERDAFLRVSGLDPGGEKGLLGLAFHPNYSENGRLYVYASQSAGGHHSEVFEYTVTGDPATSLEVDADSRKSVLSFLQPFSNHNGGWIGFNPLASEIESSYLYIASGDGGSGGDPRNNAQDITNNFLGKMLRVDIDGDDFEDDDARNYAIPPSNPFVDQTGDDEIWLYGLRNPWRNSFDRDSGDLWIGDVGQSEIEEIDVVPFEVGGGLNLGWRVVEGTSCHRAGGSDGNPGCDETSFYPPIYEYEHGFGEFEGASVTGGYVYRGPVKEFQGHYFFADFNSGNIWTLDPYSGNVVNRNDELVADAGSVGRQISSFAEDNAGNLYMVGILGQIFQVESSSADAEWLGTNNADIEDASNWVRNGMANEAFVNGDHLIVNSDRFEAAANMRVSAIRFDANSELVGAGLEVVSGNVSVSEGMAARVSGLNGPGSVRKTGAGTLEVTGESDDLLVIQQGSATLIETQGISVLIDSDGTLLHDGVAALSVPQLTIETGGTLQLQIAGTEATPLLAEHAILAGNLDLQVDADLSIAELGRVLIRATESSEGQFDAIRIDNVTVELGAPTLLHAGSGAFGLVTQIENTLSIVGYQARNGDLDGNGTVDFADFLALSDAFGQAGDWSNGDSDGDSEVGFPDFLALSANFGTSQPLPANPVPEPASGVLLCVGLLCGIHSRRRRGYAGTSKLDLGRHQES